MDKNKLHLILKGLGLSEEDFQGIQQEYEAIRGVAPSFSVYGPEAISFLYKEAAAVINSIVYLKQFAEGGENDKD